MDHLDGLPPRDTVVTALSVWNAEERIGVPCYEGLKRGLLR
jgi:hypothetical protein